MGNVKIKFVQDYTQQDSDYKDGERQFVEGEVVSLNESSVFSFWLKNKVLVLCKRVLKPKS